MHFESSDSEKDAKKYIHHLPKSLTVTLSLEPKSKSLDVMAFATVNNAFSFLPVFVGQQ